MRLWNLWAVSTIPPVMGPKTYNDGLAVGLAAGMTTGGRCNIQRMGAQGWDSATVWLCTLSPQSIPWDILG